MRVASVARAAVAALFAASLLAAPPAGLAQSRRQTPAPESPQKKNKRPDQTGRTGEEPPPKETVQDPADVVKVASALVNVEAVVINKRTKQIVTGLKRENFHVFEDNVKQEITNFSTPEAPITVAMVLEYSNLLNNYLRSDYYEPGRYEILRPMAYFLSQFIKPPDDYVSVVAYDMRATPITDFTNDPQRINQVVSIMLRARPVSNEANLYDALKLVLVGGRADAVVLEESKSRTAEYGGMTAIQGRRKAVFLVSTGIDTFSKINYDQARRVAQDAGIPIYVIGVGNLFMKKYGDYLPPTDGLLGTTTPGRMTLLQAQNTLSTFAKETGGEYFPITFEGELTSALQSINALMRNQYSLGYNPGERRDGKKHKIVVKVDVDGDGTLDEKDFIVKARQFYNAPKPDKTSE